MIIKIAGNIKTRSNVNYRIILFESFSIVLFSISLKVCLPDFFTILRISSNEGIAIKSKTFPAVERTGLAPNFASPNVLSKFAASEGISSVYYSISLNAFLKKILQHTCFLLFDTF